MNSGPPIPVTVLPLGNVGSLRRALVRAGGDVRETMDPVEAAQAERLVVPGVGRFGAYMETLRARGLDVAIRQRIERKAPTLGVCVGMQALTQGSDEDPGVAGLGVIPARCARVSSARSTVFGWTDVRASGAPVRGHAYFVHGFGAPSGGLDPAKTIIASHETGRPFLAGWIDGALLATQFHPEKSGQFGADLLSSWLRGSATSIEPGMDGAAQGVTRRVIACLDVKNGRLVKGEQFVNLVDHGDPAEAAALYEAQGADEIVVLDIGAAPSGADTMHDVVHSVADRLSVPLTAGGGVRSVEDAQAMFESGADKVAINTSAVRDPSLLTAISDRWGAQATVLAIDARLEDGEYVVTTHGGRTPTALRADAWAREGVQRGAGEILLTSMDRDGANTGYDLAMIQRVGQALNELNAPAPIVASGGYGAPEHPTQAIEAGADAALLAGALHRREVTIETIKQAMRRSGVEVRACSSQALI